MIAQGNEYSEAIFMLAQESGRLEEYSAALTLVCEQFRGEPLYMQFLSSPNIPRSERQSAVEKAFGEAVPQDVLSLLALLIEHGKIAELYDIAEGFEALKSSAQNTSVATVTSAVELMDTQLEALKSKLQKVSGKNVIIESRIDKSIIGGIVVELDGKLIDGSIKRQITEVKEVIGK